MSQNRKIVANLNYHMSIKTSQAILKCFIDLKSLARESSGQSFFLRILYRSFSFPKVSKSSTTATKYGKYKVKKVQTLESISREQDVISSLVTYFYISHALPFHWRTGRIFRSKATLRNRVYMLKRMTENKCLTYF